jgi:predicted acyl esterase
VGRDWHGLISQPKYKIETEKDVYVPLRDGVHLAVDVYRPDASGKFPALLALSPYGKELQELARTFLPQSRPNSLWDGCIEAGDMNYIVPRGYVHVIADSRGTGHSEGEYAGVSGIGGFEEGEDGYDLVEWIAQQPWCDGNVGMIGISYYACVQIQTAAERPPHLKAIFPWGGAFDTYRMNYHGGIFWVMLRSAIDGRGGDSGFASGNIKSRTMLDLTKEEFQRRLEERLSDPDIKNYPNFYHLLNYPEKSPAFLDLLLNPYDGPFYWKGVASRRFDKVDVPVFTGVNWGRAWFVEESLNCYLGVNGPKKLLMMPFPPMIDRPFHELHDVIIRWYDHWLKGINTGMMDEPPIKIFVGGVNQMRHEQEWPLARTKWTEFYLRPRNRLSPEPEPMEVDCAPPDGFFQASPVVSDVVQSVKYASLQLAEDMEVTGPLALYLCASIDSDDTNWMVKISDVDPLGNKMEISTGWLKASHRELDEGKSTPWRPSHPHTRSIPVPPGEIIEYAIPIGATANVFRAGHRIELEIKSVESTSDPSLALLAPDSFHLNSSRSTTHKIYRDRVHQSRLLLPVIPK